MTTGYRIFLLLLATWTLAAPSLAEPNHDDHEALRGLLKGATAAINEQKFDELSKFFHPELRVTTVNQDSIVKPAALEPYFRDWIGPEQYVQKMSMSMDADELTEFYGEGSNRFGVVRGKGVEDYDLTDGRHLKLDTRWTAAVFKDEAGEWKILALHLGTNFYKNPIVEELQNATKTYTLAGLGGGLLFGLLIGFFLGSRRR